MNADEAWPYPEPPAALWDRHRATCCPTSASGLAPPEQRLVAGSVLDWKGIWECSRCGILYAETMVTSPEHEEWWLKQQEGRT